MKKYTIPEWAFDIWGSCNIWLNETIIDYQELSRDWDLRDCIISQLVAQFEGWDEQGEKK